VRAEGKCKDAGSVVKPLWTISDSTVSFYDINRPLQQPIPAPFIRHVSLPQRGLDTRLARFTRAILSESFFLAHRRRITRTPHNSSINSDHPERAIVIRGYCLEKNVSPAEKPSFRRCYLTTLGNSFAFAIDARRQSRQFSAAQLRRFSDDVRNIATVCGHRSRAFIAAIEYFDT